MNNINKIITLFILGSFIYGLFPVQVFSQNNNYINPQTIIGFDNSVFNFHFNKADRELNPEKWLYEARKGIGLALNAWEIHTIDMFFEEGEKEIFSKIIMEWSEKELESRFEEWLLKRFFGTEAENFFIIMNNNLSNVHKRYTYYLDEDRLFNEDLKFWNEEIYEYNDKLFEIFSDDFKYKFIV